MITFLGYPVDEVIEAAEESYCYIFECMEGCGGFDDPVFNQDDVPQCPVCGSADVAFDEKMVDQIMCDYESKKEGIYSNAMCEAKAAREAEV